MYSITIKINHGIVTRCQGWRWTTYIGGTPGIMHPTDGWWAARGKGTLVQELRAAGIPPLWNWVRRRNNQAIYRAIREGLFEDWKGLARSPCSSCGRCSEAFEDAGVHWSICSHCYHIDDTIE